MTEETTPSPILSTAAVIGFVIVALVLPALICGTQWVTWFMEQLAVATASLAPVAVAGKVGLILQAIVLIITCGAYYWFSHNPLRPVYQGWFIASLLTLPAVALRFVDQNQDQIGAILQIVLALIASAVVVYIRRKSLVLNPRLMWAMLAVIPLVIWPFLLWGALGSGMDTLLQLLAGLSFGVLAATLIATPANNFLLNGLGVSALLAILGGAFGYDGSQLLLLALLPPFGFAVAALSPSFAAAAIGIGLLTATPFIFIDPTELSIVLGDLFPWAMRAVVLVVVLELIAGVGLWAYGKWKSRPTTIALPVGVSILAWIVGLALFLVVGQKGFHGDEMFVIMKDQPDLSNAYTIKDRNERLTYVYQTLTQHADSSQADIRKSLDRFGIKYQPYYLVNALEVNGGTLVRLYLSSQPGVDRIIDSPHLRPLPEAPQAGPANSDHASHEPAWDITMIGADKVWQEFGVTGEGITVGQSDTGVDGQHSVLHDSYRGLTEGDDYNWYDPWNGTKTPTDDQGHGTHTLGSILGSDGIGVAPGAQWMACVILARNLGNPAAYLTCLQFLLAPFPQGGDPLKDGDPTKAAYVLNNSWGCPPIEGCDANSLKPAADALKAAGIFVVVSTGNDGPQCETINAPLSLYDSVFSVGAVDEHGDLADFSSRGPVTVDGSTRRKPDIIAPGVDVLSAWPGGGYASESGTSMAGPHVVGVVTLLWSAAPNLIGDVDQTIKIIEETAKPYTGTVLPNNCEKGPLPNNSVGYGIIDAYAAVKLALGK